MKRDIMAVYGHGTECMGVDWDWEAAFGYIDKGFEAVTKVVQAGKSLLTPTQKAQTSAITGGSSLIQYGTPESKPFPIVPVAIGAGVLLLAAVFMLKK
jgi:hypothetical protein